MYGPDDDDSAPSAVLTDRQRRWITGEIDDISGGAERAMKARIRERIEAGIFDINLLMQQHSVEELEKALSEPDWYEEDVAHVPPLEDAISALAGLIYLRAHELERELGQREDDDSDGQRTALHVRGGIDMALGRLGVAARDIDVEINVNRGEDLDTLVKRGELADVSEIQLAQLKQEGKIDGETFSEVMIERILNSPTLAEIAKENE